METATHFETVRPRATPASTPPIRELGVSERSLFLAHLLALGAEDRYLRFGSPLSDSAIAAYVDGIAFRVDTIFGVFDDRLALEAAGHFSPITVTAGDDARRGRSAEFGLSVAERARGRGLGTALFLRAASHARNLNVSSLFMHCLSENRAMIRIARKAGMRIEQRHGEADAYLALAPGTLATAIEEGAQRQIALFDFAVKRHLLLARKTFGPRTSPGGSVLQAADPT